MPRTNGDSAVLRRELQCIAQQILNHPLDQPHINHDLRQIKGNIAQQLLLMLLCQNQNQRIHLIDHTPDIGWFRFQFQPAGFELAQIKDRIYNTFANYGEMASAGSA